MIKKAVLIMGLMAISGCATTSMKEARCKCFRADGTASGSCDFTPLPGNAAVYSFMASGTTDLSGSRMSVVWAEDEGKEPELCGA